MKLIEFIETFRDKGGQNHEWDHDLWEKLADAAYKKSGESYVGTMDEIEVARGLDDLYWMIKAGLFEDYSGADIGTPVITRARAAPSAWTFTIKPIRELLDRYVGDGVGWVDPFAGENSPAEYTNDQHPDRKARWHMDAELFCQMITRMKRSEGRMLRGVIFDPPYSYRQVSEHYKGIGLKAKSIDTSANFYNRVMNAICDQIEPGGYAISCGWNSNAFGMNRGFEIVEILLVAHGSHHNDTIVTVEKKVRP